MRFVNLSEGRNLDRVFLKISALQNFRGKIMNFCFIGKILVYIAHITKIFNLKTYKTFQNNMDNLDWIEEDRKRIFIQSNYSEFQSTIWWYLHIFQDVRQLLLKSSLKWNDFDRSNLKVFNLSQLVFDWLVIT